MSWVLPFSEFYVEITLVGEGRNHESRCWVDALRNWDRSGASQSEGQGMMQLPTYRILAKYLQKEESGSSVFSPLSSTACSSAPPALSELGC